MVAPGRSSGSRRSDDRQPNPGAHHTGGGLGVAAAASDQVEARGDSGFGNVHVLRFPLSTAKGAGIVLSVWIVRHGEDFPRLTTCYIV